LQIFDSFFSKYSSEENTITLSNFKAFLAQQGDSEAFKDSDLLIANFMRDFTRDPRQNNFDQDYEKGFFCDKEFINYLFSHHNELFDPQHESVNQDMTQPLSSYWIASSHNT
jgi:phosphatidylinositol phospholipase C gamma-1